MAVLLWLLVGMRCILLALSDELSVQHFDKIETAQVIFINKLNCKLSARGSSLVVCLDAVKASSAFLVGFNKTTCVACFNDATIPLVDLPNLDVKWMARKGKLIYSKNIAL